MYYTPILSAILKPKPWLLTKQVLKRNSSIGYWNKDYKPGLYPKTFEERIRAAAKYNMDVEDYVPYKSDDIYGDYPKLPDLSEAGKDPFYPWDSPEIKRNFYEPMHVDVDLYGEQFFDIDLYYKLRPSFNKQLAQFVGMVLFFSIMTFWCEGFKMFHGVAPKQFPHQDVDHYTFEQCADKMEEEVRPIRTSSATPCP